MWLDRLRAALALPAILVTMTIMATMSTMAATVGAGAEAAVEPRQGAARLKVDILGVFAHPDDETGVASTVAHYALGRGRVVAHAYMTRGEGGGNMVGTQAGAALGLLREVELRDCLHVLGVRQCVFLDQLDWAYTESLAATLRKWGHEETLSRLVRVVRALRPEMILTMNPAPNPGQHGHHQAAGILAIEAFAAAADPARFPLHLTREGLTPWQVRKLYVSGGGTNATARIDVSAPLSDGRTAGVVAALALSNHRSQAFGGMNASVWLSRPQSFILARSAVGYAAGETDLWARLPAVGAVTPELAPGAEAPAAELEFQPRPAVDWYRRWSRAQGVVHLGGTLRADLPLVAGEANEVRLALWADVPDAARAALRVSGPEGWRVEGPVRWERGGAARRTGGAAGTVSGAVSTGREPQATAVVRVTPPSGRPADGELRAELDAGGRVRVATAIGHPVPVARVARVRRGPAMDGTGAGWEGIAAWRIASTDLAQGRAEGDADSSAVFRLAHDGRSLFVDVEVMDDRVVTNIAPNDIKGHWRSDSVEICLDPAGGAEDTLGGFKLGIFPFDAAGVVRGARDADARPGLVEETSPGTRLVSTLIPGGYRVQAIIPWAEVGPGVNASKGRRLGFNLIIYDGDKAGAAPGENINESRVAWSPRSGVQGRPEDWGRIDLE